MVDEKTKQNFLICLTSLKLLAKMLSYLVHLPYNVEHGNLNLIVNSQIELRARVSENSLIYYFFFFFSYSTKSNSYAKIPLYFHCLILYSCAYNFTDSTVNRHTFLLVEGNNHGKFIIDSSMDSKILVNDGFDFSQSALLR